jgi:hypothetical protein
LKVTKKLKTIDANNKNNITYIGHIVGPDEAGVDVLFWSDEAGVEVLIEGGASEVIGVVAASAI